jgi:hypothetical protein
MEAQSRHPWEPNWEQRLTSSVQSLGYADLTALLASMPLRAYSEVAQRIGPRVAPIQVISMQFEEARARNTVRDAAMDSLCRNIIEELPNGWATGERAEWKAILALSSWSSEVQSTGRSPELKPVVHRIADHFRSQPPPTGWLPTGPDDPFIVSAFDECWPGDT